MSAPSDQPRHPFLLLFRDTGPDMHRRLPPEEQEALTKRWNDWYDGLAAQGKVQHGQPLEATGRVVAGPGGSVTDGPFVETKEMVAGYFFLTVADLDEATAIARQCPSLEVGVTVEVRPLAVVSPALQGIAGRPPRAAQR